MSDLDDAIDTINTAAARAEVSTTFADEYFTADDTTDVTNDNNGVQVPSAQKKIKELWTENTEAAQNSADAAAISATQAEDARDEVVSSSASIAANSAAIDTLNTSMSTAQSDITALNSALDALTLRVDALESVDTDAPVFISGDTLSISDGLSSGTVVYTAEATDISTVTYSLSGADASSFSINSLSGEVTNNSAIDYATKSTYNFTVTAIDVALNTTSLDVELRVRESDNLWTFDDPLTIGDVTQYHFTTGSKDGVIELGSNYFAQITISSMPATADIMFLVGGSFVRLNGVDHGPGTYTIPSHSATDTNMIFQEFAADFGSSGTVIEDIQVELVPEASISLDINTYTQLKSTYTAAYPTTPSFTHNGDTDGTLSFTTDQFLYFYRNAYKLSNETFWIDEMVSIIDNLWLYTDVQRVSRDELTVTAWTGTDTSTKASTVYKDAPYPHIADGTPCEGWSSLNASDGVHLRNQILTDGQILGAIAKCCDLILDDATLSSYHATATGWLNSCVTVLADHESHYTTTTFSDYSSTYGNVQVEGYYYPDELGTDNVYSTVLPFNHPMGAYFCGLILDKHGINSTYVSKAQAWMDFMRLSLCRTEIDNGDGTFRYEWLYGIDTNFAGEGSEDINHGAFYLPEILLWSYENGYLGLTNAEMTRYANAIYHAKLTNSTSAESYDGSGTLESWNTTYLAMQAQYSQFNSNLLEWIGATMDANYTTGSSGQQLRAYSELLLARDGEA